MQPLDWLVVAAYAALLVFLGWRASRGQTSADGHLRANRSLPAWAVVFSILATEISAATYIGVPETGFKGDWTYLQFAIGNLLGKVALATFVIGLYWKLNLQTAYGFLGQRIGQRSQRASAWGFLAGRMIASGVRLYIAALAFSVVTQASLTVAILAMAGLSTIYTLLGGLKAIVWTDVAQGMTFLIGAAAALCFGLMKTPIPLSQGLEEIASAAKMRVLSFDANGAGWYSTAGTLPMAILGGFFLVLATHGTDQINVQHLLSTRTEKGATRSLVAAGLFTFPVVILFLSVGTMLWLYHAHVEVTAYDPADTKRIFPHFIIHAIPSGLRGLVLAGLFAAAVASLGATLNAAAATWTRDLFPPRAGAEPSVRQVRVLSALFGAVLAGVALFFAAYDAQGTTDLVQVALSAMTIVYGGILGAFACALVPGRRFGDGAVCCGFAAGCAVGLLLFFQRELLGAFDLLERFGLQKGGKLIEWPLSIPIALACTLGVAALMSRAFPPREVSA